MIERRIEMERALDVVRTMLDIDAVLREAYYSSDNDMPSILISGIASGERCEGAKGPIEAIVRGIGLDLDGLKIGTKYRIRLEELEL